eukprot:gene12377-14522_t
MPLSQDIDLQFLSKYFHLPINDVAKEIGVCATVLKKICRKNGIPRWPHRKIKSIDKMISNLENTTPKNIDEDNRIREEVTALKKKKAYLIKHPNILAIKSSIKQKEAEMLNQKINENQFELLHTSSSHTPIISLPLGSGSNFGGGLVQIVHHGNEPQLANPYLVIQRQPASSQQQQQLQSPILDHIQHSNSVPTSPINDEQRFQYLAQQPSFKVSTPLATHIIHSRPAQLNFSAPGPSSDLWKLTHHQDSPFQTLKQAAAVVADEQQAIAASSASEQQPALEQYAIQLPKLQIPDADSPSVSPLKTLEPSMIFGKEDNATSSIIQTLSPPLTSHSLHHLMNPQQPQSQQQQSQQQVVPLPSWFKKEHDQILSDISAANNANNATTTKKSSITRVDQLISDEEVQVPSHLHPSSPIIE